MRREALEMLYESVKARVGIGCNEFCAAFDSWNVHPLLQEGRLVGAMVEKCGEVHVGYGKKPSGSIVKHIRAAFAACLAERGWLSTKVSESNQRGLRFCKRLGFEEVKRENGVVFMRCERCKYA